ncbi:MAG: PAS domain S-box protein [Candidatus Paceibacteria bacterium]
MRFFFKKLTEVSSAPASVARQGGQDPDASEQKFHAVFDAVPDMMIISRLSDGRIIEANEGYTRMLGYSRDESIGKTSVELSIWANQDERTKLVEPLREGGQIIDYETTLRRKDGTTIDVLGSARLFRINGEPSVLSTAHDITERKSLTDELLKTSSDKYRLLVDNLSVGVYRNTPGPEGHFLEANPAMIAMFEGGSKEEFMKHNVSDLYQDPVKRKSFVDKLMNNGFVRNEELSLVTLKGKKLIGSVTATVEKNKDGSIYFDGTIEDITERKRLEEQAREYAEEKFKVIFNGANDGMVLADATTYQFNLANPAFCRLLGYDPEEIPKLHVSDIHPESDLPHILELINKQLQGELAIARDIPVKKKDGTILVSDMTASLISVEGKRYLLGIFRDVTERKEAEERLAEEKSKAEALANDLKKFKLALDTTSDMVVITDPSGIVVYGNPATERMTGYTIEEAVGKESGILWREPMPKEYYENLNHTTKDLKKPFIGEIQNKRKNGELYTAMIDVSPVLDSEGNIIFYASLERDITKEKEIDKAKDEFISLASHQMRTPLTAINWYSEMLLDGDAGELNTKQMEYFNEVNAAGRRMNEIIKSFLHILRLETGTVVITPVSVDLVSVAKAVVTELRLDIEKRHIHIVEQYDKAMYSVKTDSELVHIIVQNLVSNAVKYSAEKGEVSITIGNRKGGDSIAGKPVFEDSVMVSVHDVGIGITEADSDKIFSKFFRAENAKQQDPNGNGIGLYMAKFMVDLIGGTIWFESEEGKGTTFYLLIPVDGKKPE